VHLQCKIYLFVMNCRADSVLLPDSMAKAAPVIQAAQDNDLAAVQRLLAEVRRGLIMTCHGRMLLCQCC
jgi:hypothetical protein